MTPADTILYAFVAIFVYTSSAMAAPAPIITSTQDSGSEDNRFGIGFTQSVTKRPFIGVDDQTASLPYFSYRNKQFYVEGLDIGYKFYNSRHITASLFTTPRFYEVRSSFAKDGELNGINETKPSYFAGASIQFHTTIATITFQALRDLVESDGTELVIQASKAFKTSKSLTLTPSIGLTYQNTSLVAYYYGVQPNEVAAGRPQYDGDTSTNYNVTLNASWDVTKHLQLLAQLKYETLGEGITDSPIVDEDNVNFITLGFVYRF